MDDGGGDDGALPYGAQVAASLHKSLALSDAADGAGEWCAPNAVALLCARASHRRARARGATAGGILPRAPLASAQRSRWLSGLR